MFRDAGPDRVVVPKELVWRGDDPVIAFATIETSKLALPFWHQALESSVPASMVPLDSMDADISNLRLAGAIYHMTRCGSTLMARQFSCLPATFALSEPFIFLQLLDHPHPGQAVLIRRLRLLWAAHRDGLRGVADRLVVKWPSQVGFYADEMQRAFPEVPAIFLHRDPVEILASIAKAPLGGARNLRPDHFIDLYRPADMAFCAGDMLELWARALASICVRVGCATEARTLDYKTLPSSTADLVAPFFGMTPSPAERRRMTDIAAVHSKDPEGSEPFKPDPVAGAAAGPDAKRLAGAILAPALAGALAKLRLLADAAKTPRPWRWALPGPAAMAMPAADALLRQALSADPASVTLRRQLAGIYYDQARWEEAIGLLGDHPLTDGVAAHLAGQSHLAARQLDLAIETLERACRLGAFARTDLAEAIRLRDGAEAAASLCQSILAENPHDTVALAIEGGRLLQAGDTAGLLALGSGLTARGADNAELLALMACAHAMQGDDAAVAQIVDYERCIGVRPLAVGNTDPGDFRRQLAAEIVSHPNRTAPNPRRATVGGERVNALTVAGAPLLHALAGAIRAAAQDFAEQLPRDMRLPGRRGGASVALDIWSVILRDGGYQDWHLHPRGRVSGVYYVSVPKRREDAGALEFGLLPGGPRPFPAWQRTIAPEEGLLVLFPSSYVHRTGISQGPEPRISVSFDVIPA